MSLANVTQNGQPASTVVHAAQRQRFELPLDDGSLALVTYHQVGQVLVLDHTEVPPAGQGKGVAAKVVVAALDYAREQGLKVQPLCSYVAAYMQRHPHLQDLLEGKRPS